jgi:hypothetical protein
MPISLRPASVAQARRDQAVHLEYLGFTNLNWSSNTFRLPRATSATRWSGSSWRTSISASATLAPDRRNDTELGHVAADRVRQLDALPHQHQTCPRSTNLFMTHL